VTVEASNIKRRLALFVDRVDQLPALSVQVKTRVTSIANVSFAHPVTTLRSQHSNRFPFGPFGAQVVKRNGRVEGKHDTTSNPVAKKTLPKSDLFLRFLDTGAASND
jgi:hypothetical protein